MADLADMIADAADHFRKGMGLGLVGFATGAIVQALIQSLVVSYVPAILISVGFFGYGMFADAETLMDRRHWLVFGMMVIEIVVEPLVLLAGIGLLVAGWVIKNYYSL